VSATAGPDSPQPGGSDELGRARRLAQAVERVADHGIFRPTCLVKSVALQRLLRSHGIRGSRIHIGVRLRDGDFVAHAWVDLHGTVLNDTDAHVGGFDPLCDVDLAGRS